MSPVAAERASAASAAALSCCEPAEPVGPETPDLLLLPQPPSASAPASRPATAMTGGRLGMAGRCHSEPECLLNNTTDGRPAVLERRRCNAGSRGIARALHIAAADVSFRSSAQRRAAR